MLPTPPDPLPSDWDVIVVGGGPAGTTIAHLLAKDGYRVLILEKQTHPRFAIGESLLPCTTPVWEQLGIADRMAQGGYLRKFGAYFCFADGEQPEYFHFPNASGHKAHHAYEVERSEFDRMLWDEATAAGAVGVQQATVRQFRFEGDRCVGVSARIDGQERDFSARLVCDCSGRTTALGKQLDIRRPDPFLDKIALYRHYDDVIRSTGDDEGTIGIIATDFGWMWFIPFSGGRASLGAVVHNDWFASRKAAGQDADAMWADVLDQAPHVAARLRGAQPSRPVSVTANFQHRCDRQAGDGWVMVGDAGAFLDPVFSSGVHLAMTGASLAAAIGSRSLRNGRAPVAADWKGYERKVRGALSVFTKFIYAWYDPYFRQVFMRPPHDRPFIELLKREIIAVLAGDVFRPWRVMPAIQTLLILARIQKWATRHGRKLPAPRAA